jgi:hypothetical protein
MFYQNWEIVYCNKFLNLWISKGAHDIFAFFINFLGSYWQPKQMTIELFEAIETIGQNLATNLTKLLDQYGWRKNNYCICEI